MEENNVKMDIKEEGIKAWGFGYFKKIFREAQKTGKIIYIKVGQDLSNLYRFYVEIETENAIIEKSIRYASITFYKRTKKIKNRKDYYDALTEYYQKLSEVIDEFLHKKGFFEKGHDDGGWSTVYVPKEVSQK